MVSALVSVLEVRGSRLESWTLFCVLGERHFTLTISL